MYYLPHIQKSKLNEIIWKHTYFVYYFLLFFCVLNVFTSYAQQSVLPLKSTEKEYVFNEIKLSNGEPIRDVLSMVQDKRGFIWMASEYGLYRYDGHDFKIFRHKPGDNSTITDSNLLTLFILGDTTLCVGAVHGISLIDLRTEKITNILYDQDGLQIEHVNQFFPDTDGTLWITGLNGLYSLKPDLSGVINHYLNTPPTTRGNPAFAKRAYCIEQHPTDNNILMIGTEYGLVSFDKKRDKIHKTYPNTKATFHRSAPPVSKFIREGNYLWSLCWISGIPRFDMINETWENFAYPKPCNRLETTANVFAIRDMCVKNDNELWICDWDRGLFIFDKKEQQLKPIPGIQNSPVLKKPYLYIFILSDSAIWLSNEEGLWKQNRKAQQFRELNIPYEGAWVMSYCQDRETNDYYFGLVWQSYGIAHWNTTDGKWTFLQTETDQKEMLNTYDLYQDRKGVVWAGMGGRGLWYIDKKNSVIRKFSLPDTTHADVLNGTIYKIFEDSRDNLWIGTGKRGVACINPARTKAVFYQNNPADSTSLFGGTHFRAIEEDNYGRIWFGSHCGFCTFDPATGKFSQEIPRKLYSTGVKPSYTYSIQKDTTGAMWLTIVGEGLVKISEKNKGDFCFKLFQSDEGLRDNDVKYMTKDKKGNLWIVNNGLLYFNPYNESYAHTDDRNGLLRNISVDARIFIDNDGNVITGRQVGLNWVNEVKQQSQSQISNLIIEYLLVNGAPYEFDAESKKKFLLSEMKNQNNIIFKYTAICFEEYEQVRYRYKLEGLEDDWNPPTNSLEARYTNLKAGNYRFVVDAAYKGNWLGLNKTVEFSIKQVFWKTWWFISLIIIIISSIIYAIYLNRKRQREQQQQIRLKIASDLHDDVGSTLSSISIMSDILQSNLENTPNTEEMIREIGSNAHNMLESMDDIIWSVVPLNDSFESLIARVQEYAIPLFESKDIQFKITAPQSIYSLSIPIEKRRDLFLVAKEAVNNLVKYSDCTEANIEFSVSHGALKMTVSDNGKGFDTSQDYSRNGLKNMKYRTEKIGGKLTIQSEMGKGTTVTLLVRVG